ncbi:MAG TPA: hypothetical protein VGE52_21200 [Pirellulales bacterium]
MRSAMPALVRPVLVAATLSLVTLGCSRGAPPLAEATGRADPAATSEASPVGETAASPEASSDLLRPAEHARAAPVSSVETTGAAIAPTSVNANPPKSPPDAADHVWYTPAESDFRAVYDRDRANAERQSWSDYWAWVNTFYNGSFVASGWKSQAADLIKGVKNSQAQARLRAALNAFGRRVAGEWAKHGDVRRINTTDLLELGPRLQVAKDKDDGSGASLQAEIDSLQQKIDERFR